MAGNIKALAKRVYMDAKLIYPRLFQKYPKQLRCVIRKAGEGGYLNEYS